MAELWQTLCAELVFINQLHRSATELTRRELLFFVHTQKSHFFILDYSKNKNNTWHYCHKRKLTTCHILY